MRVRIAAGHPGLRAGTYAATEATQEAIAEVLVADGVGPFEARVASAAVLAALLSLCSSGAAATNTA